MTCDISYILTQTKLRKFRKNHYGKDILDGKTINKLKHDYVANSVYLYHSINKDKKELIDNILEKDDSAEMQIALNDILSYNEYNHHI